MMSDLQTAFDAALRTDFMAFLEKSFATASGGDRLKSNWHMEAIAWELERIRSKQTNRLIITMPPRNLKSITCSVAWVAWQLGREPSLKFVCVSYSNDLARKHANDCRAIMQEDWYKRAFPDTVIQRGNAAEMDFKTTAGGGRLSTSVGGTLTGRGGDIIIIDDPIKSDDAMSEAERTKALEWYSNTLVSRLNDKEAGAIILVMQRLHEEDLAGHLLESGGWEHLSLPAIAETDLDIRLSPNGVHTFRAGDALHPERESVTGLNELKRIMGSAVFAAQYQQDPVPADGLYVKKDWLRFYDSVPERQAGDRIVQSWDTASKDGPFSDYSVCITALVRQKDIYILDVFRAKLQFPELKRQVVRLARTHGADALLIEDAASGQQLIQVLRHEKPHGVPRPIARKPETDKQSRFSAETHRMEAGDLSLPRAARWLDDFVNELLGFPNRKHDDQVDALVQLLAWSSAQPMRRYHYSDEIRPKLFEG